LRRLFARVPRSSVKIVFSRDFFNARHTSRIVREALTFVGLDATLWNASIAQQRFNS
jgi:hypothetical protein